MPTLRVIRFVARSAWMWPKLVRSMPSTSYSSPIFLYCRLFICILRFSTIYATILCMIVVPSSEVMCTLEMESHGPIIFCVSGLVLTVLFISLLPLYHLLKIVPTLSLLIGAILCGIVVTFYVFAVIFSPALICNNQHVSRCSCHTQCAYAQFYALGLIF